jgi:hypothetical protein
MMWKPIETAPKDGTRVLLFFPVFGTSPRQELGKWETQKHNKKPAPYWSGDCESVYGVNWYRAYQPTHWQPQQPQPDNAEVKGDTP